MSELRKMLPEKDVSFIMNHLYLKNVNYQAGECHIIVEDNCVINIKTTRLGTTYLLKRIIKEEGYEEVILRENYKDKSLTMRKRIKSNGQLTVTRDFSNAEIFENLEDILDDTYYYHINLNIDLISDDRAIIKGDYAKRYISDEKISLYAMYVDDIESENGLYFVIVLNETSEIIGDIAFDFKQENISYSVLPQFRGKHYAGAALKLLVELIKNNENFIKKNLYIRIHEDNYASLNTAKRINTEDVSLPGTGIKQYRLVIPKSN